MHGHWSVWFSVIVPLTLWPAVLLGYGEAICWLLSLGVLYYLLCNRMSDIITMQYSLYHHLIDQSLATLILTYYTTTVLILRC